jgi:putative aldouronate transport system permease protein
MPHTRLKGRNMLMMFYLLPMMFSGGLIPFFITVSNVGLNNKFWVLVIPGAVPIFSIIVMMNFFRGLPGEITEAALIDGCGHFRILTQIYMPLSVASIATVALFAIMGHWNDWFTGFIFLDKPKFPLQTYLRQLLVSIDISQMSMEDMQRIKKLSDRSYRAAQLFMAIIPILCIYPLLQKYFVTGLTLGSVKE